MSGSGESGHFRPLLKSAILDPLQTSAMRGSISGVIPRWASVDSRIEIGVRIWRAEDRHMPALEAARRYFDAWNAKDAAAILASLTADGTYSDPMTGGPVAGEPLKTYVETFWTAFPDLTFESYLLTWWATTASLGSGSCAAPTSVRSWGFPQQGSVSRLRALTLSVSRMGRSDPWWAISTALQFRGSWAFRPSFSPSRWDRSDSAPAFPFRRVSGSHLARLPSPKFALPVKMRPLGFASSRVRS